MKKLIIFLAFLVLPCVVHAQSVSPTDGVLSGLLGKLTMHQAVAFDIPSKNVTSYTSVDVIDGTGFLSNFSIGAGYSTSSAIVADASYDLGGLTKLGLNIPALSFIDVKVGFMVGISNMSFATTSGTAERNKLSYGPTLTIVSTKF